MTSRFGIPILVAVGLTAATLSYLGHHWPRFDGHALDSAFIVVLGSAAAAAAIISALPARAATADVVVARPTAITVRAMQRGDLPYVARLHATALPHGFFTTLGQPFLRAYDRTFADSPYAVAFVAEVDGHPIGFLLGLLRPLAHSRFVRRRHGGRLALMGALSLVVRPRVAGRFLRTRVGRYARAWRRSGALPAVREQEPAILSHVAVEPGARGSGTGRRLVETFVEAARRADAVEARLLTRADDGATPFYRHLGWQVVERRQAADEAIAVDELALPLQVHD